MPRKWRRHLVRTTLKYSRFCVALVRGGIEPEHHLEEENDVLSLSYCPGLPWKANRTITSFLISLGDGELAIRSFPIQISHSFVFCHRNREDVAELEVW